MCIINFERNRNLMCFALYHELNVLDLHFFVFLKFKFQLLAEEKLKKIQSAITI